MDTMQQVIGSASIAEPVSGEGHLDAMINRVTARLRLFDLVPQSLPDEVRLSAPVESTKAQAPRISFFPNS